MIVVFGATLFASAFLLFCLQPMVGKMLLPTMGGTPSVWTTCMVFFQVVYLLGNAFVLGAHRLSPRRQMVAFLCVLAAGGIVLPLAHLGRVPATPGPDQSPVGWLAGVLLMYVAPPFFALSMTSTFVQSWFSRTGSSRSADPYFLYMASNAGSLLALFLYPALLEPALPVLRQTSVWTAGYVAVALLVLACAAASWKRVPAAFESEAPGDFPPPTWAKRASWALMALLPSSLMLAVTNYLSEIIAPVPMLWVVPLALYLLTLILAFSSHVVRFHAAGSVGLVIVALPWVASVLSETKNPAWGMIPLHLAAYFVAALTCHCALARSRPAARYLPSFYFWMAIGGAAGGFLNLAIVLSGSVRLIDYPLGFAAACFFRSTAASGGWRGGSWIRRWAVAGTLGAGLVAVLALNHHFYGQGGAWLVVLAVPLAITVWFWRSPRRFAAGVALVLVLGQFANVGGDTTLFARRNFFGTVRVNRYVDGSAHALIVNSTLQGLQFTADDKRGRAIANYAPESSMGQLMAAIAERNDERIAVVGLGAGGIAAYATPSQDWTFYELNPAVYEAAGDPQLFTFLRDTKARNLRVVLGDARLRLREAEDASYGVIVVDAFNAAGMPVQLVTREAMALYRSKLKPDGWLVFNVVGNPLFDVYRILCTLARDAGMSCMARFPEGISPGTFVERGSLEWVVMTGRREALGTLLHDPRWGDVVPSRYGPVWTDDYSSLVPILLPPRFRRLRELASAGG